MSYFTPQTRTVDLDKKNRVVIRRLTYGPRQDVLDASMSMTADMRAVVHVGAGKKALLYAAIVSWEGPDFDGRPVTPANIDELPPEIADAIAAQVDDFLTAVTDDEKKA